MEMHCTFCFSLCHLRKHCPKKLEAEKPKPADYSPRATWELEDRRPREIPVSSQKKNRSRGQEHSYAANQYLTKSSSAALQSRGRQGAISSTAPFFNERVDRHGNSFGDRVGTKQTRNPPPKNATNLFGASLPKTKDDGQQRKFQPYASPPYTQSRDTSISLQRGRDLFPRRSEGQWRPKRTAELEAPPETEKVKSPHKGEDDNQAITVQPEVTETQIIAREAIMEEFHEVTRQYLSCADPVEAAARRQRVLYSDANGLMEATAASIMANLLSLQT